MSVFKFLFPHRLQIQIVFPLEWKQVDPAFFQKKRDRVPLGALIQGITVVQP